MHLKEEEDDDDGGGGFITIQFSRDQVQAKFLSLGESAKNEKLIKVPWF